MASRPFELAGAIDAAVRDLPEVAGVDASSHLRTVGRGEEVLGVGVQVELDSGRIVAVAVDVLAAPGSRLPEVGEAIHAAMRGACADRGVPCDRTRVHFSNVADGRSGRGRT